MWLKAIESSGSQLEKYKLDVKYGVGDNSGTFILICPVGS